MRDSRRWKESGPWTGQSGGRSLACTRGKDRKREDSLSLSLPHPADFSSTPNPKIQSNLGQDRCLGQFTMNEARFPPHKVLLATPRRRSTTSYQVFPLQETNVIQSLSRSTILGLHSAQKLTQIVQSCACVYQEVNSILFDRPLACSVCEGSSQSCVGIKPSFKLRAGQ